MSPVSTAVSTIPFQSPAAAFEPLEQLLNDLAAVLVEIDGSAYVATPAAAVSGSIGAHVRHTLDHVAALAFSTPMATLAYDHRERGTDVESDPAAALRQIVRLKAALKQLSLRGLDDPVQVESVVSSSGESSIAWSSLRRELAFVVSHTIHHQAIIALLLAFQGIGTPDRFGYAPSTPGATPNVQLSTPNGRTGQRPTPDSQPDPVIGNRGLESGC
jgi:uncharacterized damage-inducible protein DinB